MDKREYFSSKTTKPSAVARRKKNGDYVFSFRLDNAININTDKRFSFNYQGHNIFAVIKDPLVVFDKKQFTGSEEICLIGTPTDENNEFRLKAIVSKSFYEMFRTFDDKEDDSLVFAMNKYLSLPPESQKELKEQVCENNYPVIKSIERREPDEKELRFRFDFCRASYSPQQQSDIESIFTDCKTSLSTDRNRAKRRLAYALEINQHDKSPVLLTKNQIVSQLKQNLYGLESVVDKVADAIIASKYSGIGGFNLLLVGSPGVGKTSIIRAIASVLNRQLSFIPLGSINDIVDLVGSAPQFEASDCGLIVKSFYRNRSTSQIIALDEFDKPGKDRKTGQNVRQVFNDALSDEHTFFDSFVGYSFNTKNTIFIATANSLEDIPEHLINRFTVINLPDYSNEEKIHIARYYILPQLLTKYGINAGDISISDEIILYIAANFCEDNGVRDIKKHIETIVQKILTIWDSDGKRYNFAVNAEFVDNSLANYVDTKSPAIIFRRNREQYSDAAALEISNLITKLKRTDIEPATREKFEKKLDYLVNIKSESDNSQQFDVTRFYEQVNKTHYGLADVKDRVAQIFYTASLSGKSVAANNILLVSPPGTGKTSIAQSIAIACGLKLVKVSLNGVNDSAVIKGHSFTYAGADSGRIIKGLRKAGTTKCVVLLDEIDKLGEKQGDNTFDTVVDLLDDSAEFTDNFLDVPIDLSDVLFIASANDLSKINPVIRDRFTIITMDGYMEREKEHIVNEYILPEVISDICPGNINLSFSDKAEKLITGTYCKSMGVRDAKKAVRKIVSEKLFVNRDKTSEELIINEEDVKATLGAPPRERGNFPCEVYPGLSKALAVTGENCGMAFAIETLLIPNDSSLTITGLPKESMIDSVKLAISYIKCHYHGLLDGKGIHVHFGEGAVPKDGPSAGVAILTSMLSAVFSKAITENVSYTGEINANGYVFNIGGTIAKMQAAQHSGCTRVFIPYGNYLELTEDELSQFDIEVVPVKHISEVIKEVLPDLAT